MRIVILGAPGSGKKTQSALLAEKLKLSIVTTGDLLKKAIAEAHPLGMEAKAQQDAGQAVTEDIILGLLRDHFLDSGLSRGFILDGFPRNLLQALTLDELLIELEIPLDLVILLDIDADNLMERLVGRRTCRSCNQRYNTYWNPPIVEGVCDICGGRLHRRSDDNEETVSSRTHVFEHLVAPLITHYEKGAKLLRVDGNGEVDRVFRSLLDAIECSANRATGSQLSDQVGQTGRVEPAPPHVAAELEVEKVVQTTPEKVKKPTTVRKSKKVLTKKSVKKKTSTKKVLKTNKKATKKAIRKKSVSKKKSKK